VWDGKHFCDWGTDHQLPPGRVYAFCETPDGSQWLGTVNGLFRYRGDRCKSWTGDNGLKSNRIFALAADRTGRVWFIHKDSMLGYIDEQDRPRYLGKEDGLISDDLQDLHLSRSDGALWITARDALCVYRDGRFSALTREVGLTASNLWPVLPLENRVYVGSLGQGLAVLELAQIDRTPPDLDLSTVQHEDGTVQARWQAFTRWGFPPAKDIETRWRWDAGEWSHWCHKRETNLPTIVPGKHMLEVQAKGMLADLGELFEHEVAIDPPLEQRWGFVAPLASLSLIVVLLAGALLLRRRRHADLLRASEERYRDLFENAQDLIYTHDGDGVLTSLNQVAQQVLGPHAGPGADLKALLPSEQRARVQRIWQNTLAEGSPAIYEMSIASGNGRRVLLEVSSRRMMANGAPAGLQSVARDVTERRGLEEQLNQAQKMEAIGRLAGGVAHDFNNLLTAINGYSDLVLSALPELSPAREPLEKIQRAGERAASLTRQLLAFSRKQLLERRVLDLNDIVSDLRELIGRLVGEDIQLATVLDDELGLVLADPGQMQQVILNLAANARDAMPSGGEIEISTRNVELGKFWREHDDEITPGCYVKLSLRDSGSGMDEETRARLFEPFFTTKAQGKGTGLGLCSVYGIVKQSGGHIAVTSERGVGTTFDVYLPRVATALATPPPETEPAATPYGTETLLIVEDEDDVRALMHESLATYHYTILVARDGEHALAIAEAHRGDIDLLVCDVVMPRLQGPQVVERIQKVRPRLKVLYVSGYVGDSRLADGRNVCFIHKPFRGIELARKVRDVLDSEPRLAHPERVAGEVAP
jgi:PAS domain S-box-containing protein